MATFNAYRVFHNSQTHPVAAVWCFDNEKHIGCLEFYPDDVTLPANETKDGMIWVRYPVRDFPAIMDTLRYEKPLFLSQRGAIGYVGTWHLEETGEQEA